MTLTLHFAVFLLVILVYIAVLVVQSRKTGGFILSIHDVVALLLVAIYLKLS